MVLTDVGRTVYRYADEIFALGRELQQAVKGRVTQPARLAVGVAMVVPKLVAYQILEPALHLSEPIQLDCVHERPERLVAEHLDRDAENVGGDAAGQGRPSGQGQAPGQGQASGQGSDGAPRVVEPLAGLICNRK